MSRQTGRAAPCRHKHCKQEHAACVPADSFGGFAGQMSVVPGARPSDTYLWAGPANGRGRRYVVNDPTALRKIAHAILRNIPTRRRLGPRQ